MKLGARFAATATALALALGAAACARTELVLDGRSSVLEHLEGSFCPSYGGATLTFGGGEGTSLFELTTQIPTDAIENRRCTELNANLLHARLRTQRISGRPRYFVSQRRWL